MLRSIAILALVMGALLACKGSQKQEKAAPPVATSTAAVTDAPEPAPPIAPTASSDDGPEGPEAGVRGAPRRLTATEVASLTTKIARGHGPFGQQSFRVDFKGLGERDVLLARSPNERELVVFVFDAEGKRLQGLITPESYKAWTLQGVSAVTFKDVDGDGYQDIVAVATYMTGMGPSGATPFPAALVYRRVGDRFRLDGPRSARASKAGNDVLKAARLAR